MSSLTAVIYCPRALKSMTSKTCDGLEAICLSSSLKTSDPTPIAITVMSSTCNNRINVPVSAELHRR